MNIYLKWWIAQKGLNQKNAAERLNIKPAQLNRLLNHKGGISIEKMEEIYNSTGKDVIEGILMGQELAGENSLKTKIKKDKKEEKLQITEEFIRRLWEKDDKIKSLEKEIKEIKEKDNKKFLALDITMANSEH